MESIGYNLAEKSPLQHDPIGGLYLQTADKRRQASKIAIDRSLQCIVPNFVIPREDLYQRKGRRKFEKLQNWSIELTEKPASIPQLWFPSFDDLLQCHSTDLLFCKVSLPYGSTNLNYARFRGVGQNGHACVGALYQTTSVE